MRIVDASSHEDAGHAVTDEAEEIGDLVVCRRRGRMEGREPAGCCGVGTVQQQRVQVDVEIQGGSEALDVAAW